MLGVMYLSGQFVSKDLNKAEEWLKKSLGHLHKDAITNLVRVCDEKAWKKFFNGVIVASTLMLVVAIVKK